VKRRIFSFLTAALMLVSLTACGNPASIEDESPNLPVVNTEAPDLALDAAGVWEKMSQAVDGRLASSFTATTEMGAKMDTGFMALDTQVSAETDVKLSADPFCYYAATDLKASFFGKEITGAFQMYSQSDEKGLDTWFHMDQKDNWYHYHASMVPVDLLSQYEITGCSGKWVPKDLTMEEQTLDGAKVYVLTSDFKAEDVLTAISSPFGDIPFENVDISGLQLTTTYYVDSESFLPVRIEIQYRGMSEVIGDLISRYAGEMMGGKLASMNVEVNTYREVLSNLVYGAVEVPAVPEEGIQNSREVTDSNIMKYLDLG